MHSIRMWRFSTTDALSPAALTTADKSRSGTSRSRASPKFSRALSPRNSAMALQNTNFATRSAKIAPTADDSSNRTGDFRHISHSCKARHIALKMPFLIFQANFKHKKKRPSRSVFLSSQKLISCRNPSGQPYRWRRNRHHQQQDPQP